MPRPPAPSPAPAPAPPGAPAPPPAPAPAPPPAFAPPRPPAPPPPSSTDDLTPSPEYVAAREAALAAIRAQRQTPPRGHVSERPDTEPGAVPPEALEESYAASLAVLDDLGIPTDTAQPPLTDAEAYAPLEVSPSTAPSAGRARASSRASSRHSSYSQRRKAMRKHVPAGQTGTVVPAEINGPRLAIGFLIVCAGLFLFLWYLPTRGPEAPLDPGAGYQWRFDDALFLKVRIATGSLIFVGAAFAMMGLRFRPQVEVVCKRCRQYVLAEKDGVVLKCPRSSHQARFDRATIFFIALLIASAAGIIVCMALGSIVHG